MYLTKIQIMSDTDKDIRTRCHYIARCYEELLDKFNLDNSGMLTIRADDNYDEKYIHTDSLGVSIYYLDENKREELLSADSGNIGITASSIIKDVLTEIVSISQPAEVMAESIARIEGAFRIIKDSDYMLKKTVKKLSKISKDRKYSAVAEMLLSLKYGETWTVTIYERESNAVVVSQTINSKSTNLDRRHMYHHAVWEEHTYLIFDRFGKEIKRLQV